MMRLSSATADIDKPLRAQSKALDVYSKKRECVWDCKCNAICFDQTCHMSLLCNQRSGCLPPVSKSCICCSETQKTCEDSVVVGLGREEAAFLKTDSATSSATLTFTT